MKNFQTFRRSDLIFLFFLISFFTFLTPLQKAQAQEEPEYLTQDSENPVHGDSSQVPQDHSRSRGPAMGANEEVSANTTANIHQDTRSYLGNQCAGDGGRVTGAEADGIRCSVGGREFYYSKSGKSSVEDDPQSLALQKQLNKAKSKDDEDDSESDQTKSRRFAHEKLEQPQQLASPTNNSQNASSPQSTEESSTTSHSSPSFSSTETSSSASTYSGPSGDDLQRGFNRCAQETTDAEAACDEKSNKDMSSFSSGVGRLLGMMGNRGLANTPGSCALLGAITAVTPGVVATMSSQCAMAYYSCSSSCAQATTAALTQPAFVTAIAPYKSRCESLSRKANSFTSGVQGVGNTLKSAYECQKNLQASNECLKDPIKCAFGNSDCSSPQAQKNNPICFCQYANPNDPMCALVGKIQDSNSDLASGDTSLSSKLAAAGKDLPISRVPSSSDESVNPAEALLANHQSQPVGNVELQGKSGDGLGGVGGSVLGSSQKPGEGVGKAGSNISTKINAGFLSASSFGIPAVTGKESNIKQEKRFNWYKKGLRKMYPRMSAKAVLALAHRLALRDVTEWMRLQDALNQGQTEEKLIPLKAALANETLYMDENKTVKASDFISKKQNPDVLV